MTLARSYPGGKVTGVAVCPACLEQGGGPGFVSQPSLRHLEDQTIVDEDRIIARRNCCAGDLDFDGNELRRAGRAFHKSSPYPASRAYIRDPACHQQSSGLLRRVCANGLGCRADRTSRTLDPSLNTLQPHRGWTVILNTI